MYTLMTEITDTMLRKNSFSPVRIYFTLLLYLFTLFAVARVAFWVFASPDMPSPLGLDAWKAFWIGVRFDARIAALVTLPLGVLLCIPAATRNLRALAGRISLIYALVFFVLVVVYVTDFGFYAYLHKRVSTLLFELLEDVSEAYTMVTESYPVARIIMGIMAATLLITLGFYRILRKHVEPDPSILRRGLALFVSFLLFGAIVLGQLNFSFVPLRWSNAYFSTNDAIVALGLNPLQSFYDTRRAHSQAFSPEKARNAYPHMAAFLGVDKPDLKTMNYLRHVPADTRSQNATASGKKPNIVIIFMESLSFPKTSFAPGRSNPTPHIKALAKESLLYTRFFANSRTTARAIFSTITGIPDVNEGSTSSRNPLVVDQRVVGAGFDGYDTYYLMGGNAGWANIRAIVGQNIPDIKIYEENDWNSPHADVWGISDYDLLRESHELFASRKTDKPFLAVIQTASYHKPYTVPPTPGFTHAGLDAETMQNYGFESDKEYNSMRFTDFCLGSFMERVKKAPYYHDTIFFIFGDHGLTDKNGNMPKGYNAAGLSAWHVPMILHASPKLGLVEPGVSNMTAGLIDIFPTAAALAGVAHNNHTLGRNLLAQRFDATRATYICGNSDAPIIVVEGDRCYMNNRQGVIHLYDITGSDKNIAEEEPETFRRLGTLAEHLDATARYMLYNNKKR